MPTENASEYGCQSQRDIKNLMGVDDQEEGGQEK